MGSQQSSQCASTQKPTEDDSKSSVERRFLQNFPQGFMDRDQFVAYYRSAYMSTLPDDEIHNIFDVADVDGDHKLSFYEYQMLCKILTSGSVQQKLSLTFKLYDSDRSHGITKTEIIKMLSSLYRSKGMKEPEVQKKAEVNAGLIMKKLDKDTNGILTESEFVGISSDESLVALIFGIENSS